MKILSYKDQTPIINHCKIAHSFLERLRGLIGVKKFPLGEGLFFESCNSVHMWCMSIPIDIVFMKKIPPFLSMENAHKLYKITSIYLNVKPWKFFPIYDLKAFAVLELPIGSINHFSIKKNAILECIINK